MTAKIPAAHTKTATKSMEAMKRIALHPVLQNKPFILETPNDDAGYIKEIHTVLSWMDT